MRCCATVLLLPLVSAVAASAQEVVITGGTDDGHQYTWTVSNKSNRNIDYVAFPYCTVDTLVPPEGWKAEATGGLVGQGGGGAGLFIARPDSPARMIRPGQSLQFGLRVAPAGAFRTTATVTVGFTDGSRIQVPGVECPQKEPWLRRNFPMVGLGACFLLFVLLAHIMRKRKPAAENPGETAGSH